MGILLVAVSELSVRPFILRVWACR